MMKKYTKIQPEVIVGLGEDTRFIENQQGPKKVSMLHIHLEDWLGDDLMECYPCYLVTEKLKIFLEKSPFSGYQIENMMVTRDENFENNYQLSKLLPEFYWLKIVGRKNSDHLFLDEEQHLNVDQEFLDLIHGKFDLKYLDIEPERNEFDDLLDEMIAESKAKNGESGKDDNSLLPPDWNKNQ